MIIIDGSYGEGGGQILRNSLALSMITGQTIEIRNIRAGRPKPGLRPQHLTCVKAATSVCGAQLEGDELGSQRLIFIPGRVKPGHYSFAIGTAGSVMLVFQTVLLPLALSHSASEVTLVGGTHVPWSPCFHYIDRVFRPAVSAMGLSFEMELKKWGYYPKGGGLVRTRILPSNEFSAFKPVPQSEEKDRVKAISATARLPDHVRKRQSAQAKSVLEGRGVKVEIEEIEGSATCPGSLLFCWISGQGRYGGFTRLGAKGKPAEKVADEAVYELLAFLDSGAACDKYLSDQMLLPAVLAGGESHWSTNSISNHLHTNVWVTECFGLGKIKLEEDEKLSLIKCRGAGLA
ncbi:MAG: RNA 3'-phosphate cyclase [Deltaproteobacteria bacterium]|nr:MAG: RNA 3'-phosphate cyclase [Deltaproteobacteria bacterium]